MKGKEGKRRRNEGEGRKEEKDGKDEGPRKGEKDREKR